MSYQVEYTSRPTEQGVKRPVFVEMNSYSFSGGSYSTPSESGSSDRSYFSSRSEATSSERGSSNDSTCSEESLDPWLYEPKHLSWRQLKACVIRRVLQRRRGLTSLALEVFFPLLVVAFILILWGAIGMRDTTGNKEFIREKFVEDNRNTMDFTYNIGICNLESQNFRDKYDGIASCDEMVKVQDYLFGNETRAPGDMFACSYEKTYDFDFLEHSYLNDDFDVDDPENQALYPLNEDYIPLRVCAVARFPSIFFGFTVTRMSRLDDLDTVIALQWITKIFPNTKLSTLGNRLDLMQSIGMANSNMFTALQAYGNIFFAPRANVPDELIDFFYDNSKLFQYVFSRKHFIFDTVEDAKKMIESHKFGRTMALVEIEKMDNTGLSLKLHMNKTALPDFGLRVDPEYYDGYENDRGDLFTTGGFSAIQQMVYQFYLSQPSISGITDYHYVRQVNPRVYDKRGASYTIQDKLDPTVAEVIVEHQTYTSMGKKMFSIFTKGMYGGGTPKPYIEANASYLISFLFSFCFFFSIAKMAQRLVAEKEARITEAMQVMGLNPWINYLVWLLECVVFFILVSLIMTLMLRFTVLNHSSFMLVWCVIFLFGLTVVTMAYFFASFFNSSTLVALFAPVVYCMLVCPYFLIANITPATILGISILSPSCFGAITHAMFRWDLGIGFRNAQLYSELIPPKPVYLIAFFVSDFVIYGLLGLYLEAVLPKKWGTPRHPLFIFIEPFNFFRKKCCRGCCRNGSFSETESTVGGRDGRDKEGVYEKEYMDPSQRSLDILGLRKEFKRSGKKFVAVDNFYWSLPTTGISVLLGHNGAGKSTLINMITGMIPPDAGDCLVSGVSMRRNLKGVRQRLGFCPQHNILWPELTCREHLEFYGRIKGLKGEILEEAVYRMLDEVDLRDKENFPSKALSGGQKRKLSVALAFIGFNPLVVLDEPTAGMDVGARRHTWELLLRMSRETSVLLTTHFMDEAELLGDRVGIMSMGRLMCSGSVLYLKSRLGVGYTLTFGVNKRTKVNRLHQFIQDCVEGAQRTRVTDVEIIYQVPKSQESQFPHIFRGVEENGENFRLDGLGISNTSLEEVFIGVCKKNLTKQEVKELTPGENKEEYDVVFNSDIMPPGRTLYCQQLRWTFMKRVYYGIRDRALMWFQIVSPLFFVLFAMLLNLSFRSIKDGELKLEYSSYGQDVELIVANCSNFFNNEAISSYLQSQRVTLTDVSDKVSSDFGLWEYLTAERDNHRLPRYDSIGCNLNADDLGYTGTLTPVSVFYNTSSYFNLPITTQEVYNFFLMSRKPHSRITTTIGILPRSDYEVQNASVFQIFVLGIFTCLPFNIIFTVCTSYMVKEKAIGMRHLQKIAGLKYVIYWVGNFFFDFIVYIISAFLVVMLFLIFSQDQLTGKNSAGITVLLLLLFGVNGVIFSYCVSFLFKSPGLCQVSVMSFGVVTGVLLNLVVFALDILPATHTASTVLRYIFRVSPYFSVSEGLINLNIFELFFFAQDNTLTRWSMNVTGCDLVYLGAEIPLWIAILLIFDSSLVYRFWRRRGYKEETVDSDSTSSDSSWVSSASTLDAESREGDSGSPKETSQLLTHSPKKKPSVVVRGLRKEFRLSKGCCKSRTVTAVDDISFEVTKGEILGLLGTNGAGKTTTISILCQIQGPTGGKVSVCGNDVMKKSQKAMQCIGYCPQFDATLDFLTVEEHLRVFAGLRGVVSWEQKKLVKQLMVLCGLTKYKKVKSSSLSGGNRRKLGFALSLVGGPPVVLLDEPTAGMDPLARRGLWTSIQNVSQECAVLLTTHHLEEVEALADCVAMMTGGSICCMGTKQHLKHEYGNGYDLFLQLRGVVDDPEFERTREKVQTYMEKQLPLASLTEIRGRRFTYNLPYRMKLSEVFTMLLRDKDSLGISDYSIAQSSIEQVFLYFSKEEEQERRSHYDMMSEGNPFA